MNQVRWGVLSTAKIGIEKVIPAMQEGQYSKISAIASRRMETARDAANRLGIATCYGSYEALLADGELDAVYIPLPNHLHVAWSIKAFEAGKHVLLEKPVARTSEDARRMVEASQKANT